MQRVRHKNEASKQHAGGTFLGYNEAINCPNDIRWNKTNFIQNAKEFVSIDEINQASSHN